MFDPFIIQSRKLRFKKCIHLLAICAAVVSVNGCFHLGDEAAPPYQRLETKLGNASALASWTLQQEDAGEIIIGAHALADMVGRPMGRESEVALAGYVSVVKKLEAGWPGLMVLVWKGDKQELVTVESLASEEHKHRSLLVIEGCYGVAAEVAISEYERTRSNDGLLAMAALKRVMPKENDAELLVIWEKKWDWAQQNIQEIQTRTISRQK